MKFSFSFILFLSVSLVLLILGNIGSTVYYAPRYFAEYVEEVRVKNPGDETALIGAFIESKELDPKTIEEYRLTLWDLKELTKNLEQISSTQKAGADAENTTKSVGFSPDGLRQSVIASGVTNLLSDIISVTFSQKESPEQNFLLKIFTTLFWVNLFLISLILGITFIWTKLIFRPTEALSRRLKELTESRDYQAVAYTREDEFAPLVRAVNTLSLSLSKQEKIRSDFLSDFSHEVKTPITALKVFLEWVEDGVVELDEKWLSIVQGELDRLLSVTDSIMQYEKVVALAEREAKFSEFDLLQVLRDIREEYLPSLARGRQMIALSDGICRVRLEKDLMVQLAHNVYSNFIKYAGDATTLTVRATPRVNKLTLSFSDDGAGVDRASVPYLTEKFYQADSGRATNQKNRGIGIGLSLIERIARHHHGHLTLTSDIGKGFHLKIMLEQGEK
jgi:signal transduction histidine kinase